MKLFFFFFQAEDGIRDLIVTGVQTCALPILTGSKADDKLYHRHTGWPGGIRTTTAGKILQVRPERLIEMAVRGMLPKNRLGRRLFTKLKIYRGPEHPHAAQKPAPMKV